MSATARYNQAPALWPLYGRAIIPKGGKAGKTLTGIPELSAELRGVGTRNRRLGSYRKLCGFSRHSWLPATWPHILAFPLQMSLLTDSTFPLPLLGLVHLRNRITQFRPIREGECLDLHCRLSAGETTERGLEFDIITEAFCGGRRVWQENSTTLSRRSEPAPKGTRSGRPTLERYPNSRYLEVPGDTGRRYAKISGDFNPIHLHALTARLFGFPRAIAHGMWSKARCLGLLEQEVEWKPGPLEIEAAFKKPLFLPGSAQLNWRVGNGEWPFQLLNGKGDAPHLTGRVRFLE